MTQLKTMTLEPQQAADACVIFMHGLGDSALGIKPLVDAFDLQYHSTIRFVIPDAPIREVTINQGMPMQAWYDIKNFDLAKDADLSSIQASEVLIQKLIQEQLDSGISAKRIILAGFSQGGVMALHTGLRYGETLGGLLGLSCYLTASDGVLKKVDPLMPIMIQHGVYDQVVPIASGQMAHDTLLSSGLNASWSQHLVDHSVLPEQISLIRHWLLQYLG
jgi:phospholipase/carboxylesterase